MMHPSKSRTSLAISKQELALIRASGVVLKVTSTGLTIDGQSLDDIRTQYEQSAEDLFSRYQKQTSAAAVGKMEYSPDKRALEIYATLSKQGYSHDEIVRILAGNELSTDEIQSL